ncbi:MAG TPA: GtrA family protein [Solirubrobacterales bacterium]|jgi:dolichol-phosphate mannosyltransferase
MAEEGRETSLGEESWSAPGAVAVARRIGAGTRKAANWVQLVKFGLVGASGYVINLGVFAVLNENLGVHHVLAAVGAFCVAVSSNYLWNRYWTFGAGAGPARFEAARFFAVSLGALFINLVILELLVMAELPELQAQAVAVAVAMPFNFIGNKLWTFG